MDYHRQEPLDHYRSAEKWREAIVYHYCYVNLSVNSDKQINWLFEYSLVM